MHRDLHLSGATKEVFAAIFGYWNSTGRKEVPFPYSRLEMMTGASVPTLVSALYKLEMMGYIKPIKKPGLRTMYSIQLPDGVLEQFDSENTDTSLHQPSPNAHGPQKSHKDLRRESAIDEFNDIPDHDDYQD